MNDIHVGHKTAFGHWMLIWTAKGDHGCRMIRISERTAKELLAEGMNLEG